VLAEFASHHTSHGQQRPFAGDISDLARGSGESGARADIDDFPPQLVAQANSLLKEKVLFGSDFPALSPDRWLADFAKLDIKDDVRPLILKDNAIRVLGLDSGKGEEA
jgi:hypothetical protein